VSCTTSSSRTTPQNGPHKQNDACFGKMLFFLLCMAFSPKKNKKKGEKVVLQTSKVNHKDKESLNKRLVTSL